MAQAAVEGGTPQAREMVSRSTISPGLQETRTTSERRSSGGSLATPCVHSGPRLIGCGDIGTGRSRVRRSLCERVVRRRRR